MLIDALPDAVAILRDGRVASANARAAQLFGASSPGELVGREIVDLVHSEDRVRFIEEVERASTPPRPPSGCTWRLRRLDGAEFTAEVAVEAVLDAFGCDVRVVFCDISATWRLHRELLHANRALRFLTACNEALIRAASEEDLLREICRCAVDAGGFRLAVAGYGDASDRTLRPVAWHGASEPYLEKLRRVWAEGGEGTALVAAAYRTRHPVVSTDPQCDPRAAAWRDDAFREGFTGAAALPLARGDEAIGVLLIVSSEPNDFDETMVALLRELGEDVAYGLAALRTRALLRDVVEHAPWPFFVMRSDTRFALVNRAWEEKVGRLRTEVLGRRCDQVFPSDVAARFVAMNEAVLAAGHALRADETAFLAGVRRTFDSIKFPVRDPEGRLEAVGGFSIDVTDRNEADRRLRVQAGLLEQISEAAIATDLDRRVTYMNRAAVERYAPGRTAQACIGLKLSELYTVRWDSPGAGEDAFRTVMEAGVWRGEVVHVRADGVSWCTEVVVVVLKGDRGEPVGLLGVIRDVSERKLAENALRASREELRALAARVQSAREEEKTRIARDLHDELGQQLTALQLDLRWMERRLADSSPAPTDGLLDRVVATSDLLDQVVASVQRIATDLRPGTLDQLGLGAALRREARQFAARTGTPCLARVPEDVAEPPPEVATALYRIAQEALTNVARHARATQVEVVLAADAGAVMLTIADDGCGLRRGVGRPEGLGLLGMQERATALGGEVRFERGALGGTAVVARVPLAARRLPGGAA